MGTSEAPRLSVSVIVPTRNRPEHAAGCAASILATDGFTDLVFVDQSDGRATENALAKINDRRFRYVRTETRGVSNARNLGMELTDGEIVAFTDDDCRVRADWMERLLGVFAANPDVAVVCGRVEVPAEFQQRGWAESFHPRTREWQGRYPPIGQWGITANLALRRTVPAQWALIRWRNAGAPLQSAATSCFRFAPDSNVNAEGCSWTYLGRDKLAPKRNSSTAEWAAARS